MNALTKDQKKYEIELQSLERIICIMSFTSSASCLISSLFDNHPNVLMFPDNVIQNFEDFWEQNRALNINLLIDAFIDRYSIVFDAKKIPKGYKGKNETGEARGYTKLGPKQNECLYVSADKFKQNMQKYIGDVFPVSRKLFFKAMHLSYSKSLGRKISKPVIIFGLHSAFPEFRLKSLLEDFSNVQFLSMVRNPVNATGSRLRRQVINGFSPGHFKRIIFGVARSGAINDSTSVDLWSAVRMEDLHKTPEKTMREVCQWVNLPWSEVVLESSINGKQWWNEKGSIQVSGFSTTLSSQTFEEYLSKLDKIRLNIILCRKFFAWGYDSSPWNKSLIAKLIVLPFLLIPFKIELLTWSSLIRKIWDDQNLYVIKLLLVLKITFFAYGVGRLGLFRSWLVLIRGYQIEIPLLSK